jgi:DNA polymerase-3 subunit beta
MKFSCPRETFWQGLQVVQRAVPGKTTLPILTGILLETSNDRLRLVATDLELGIDCYIPVQTIEEGSTVLEAKYLTDIVRKLPELGLQVTVDPQKGLAEIKGGKSVFHLHTMSPADYPNLPETSAEHNWSIDQGTLRRMIKETAFAVAVDESRPFLTGVLLEIAGEQVRMVATDTSRLALRQISSANEIQQASAIIPTKCLLELSRVLSADEETPLTISLSGNHILFEIPDLKFVSRLIEGQFPSYQQVIPKAYKTRVEIEREEFLAAAERASLLAREGTSIVRLNVVGELMDLTSQVAEVGESKEEIVVAKEGEDAEIAFNTRFLIDVLRTLDADKVALELTGRHSPGMLKPVSEEEYTYVIMPVMLR